MTETEITRGREINLIKQRESWRDPKNNPTYTQKKEQKKERQCTN